MKKLRLLPVVIAAAFALLLFKGVGLVTHGGYVLLGTGEAIAETHAAPAGESSADHADAAAGETTMEDTSPVLADGDPTLPSPDAGEGGGHGAPAPAEGDEAGHGAAPAEEDATHETASTTGNEHAAKPEDTATSCDPAASDAAGHGDKATPAAEPCPPAATNAHGDALPMARNAAGELASMTDAGEGSEKALLARLADRRAELDSRSAEIDTRMALVEAAEKRLDERTAALEQLETRINAVLDEKKAADDAKMKAVVSMYETMKPKEAATIFDQMDLDGMSHIAGQIAPRKMAAILEKMDPIKARDLTARLTSAPAELTDTAAEQDLSTLPRIQGN